MKHECKCDCCEMVTMSVTDVKVAAERALFHIINKKFNQREKIIDDIFENIRFLQKGFFNSQPLFQNIEEAYDRSKAYLKFIEEGQCHIIPDKIKKEIGIDAFTNDSCMPFVLKYNYDEKTPWYKWLHNIIYGVEGLKDIDLKLENAAYLKQFL